MSNTQPILPDRFLGGSSFTDVKFVNTEVSVGTGSVTVADTATTSVLLPKPPCTSCQLMGVNFGALVAALSAGGTVLAQVFKRDNSGTPADRTLTATKSIEADVVMVLDASYTIPLTATSVQNLTFQASDACRIDIVTTSSVGTQPTMSFAGLWAIIQP